MEKQVDLTGQPITVDEENPDVAVLKSALQKSIRKGLAEKAMAFSLMLLEKAGWYVTWRRLRIIAVEDCGIPETINTVETLYRMFLEFKGKNGGKEISWDCKRLVVCAAKIMAESPKDRRADEFLELWDAMEKRKDVKALQNLRELWTSPPDESYDCHTIQGRKLGRGLQYWYAVSSRCTNMTEQYARWREWWQGLMVALVKNKTNRNYINYAKCQQDEKTENQNRYYPTNREVDEKSENKNRTTTPPEESD